MSAPPLQLIIAGGGLAGCLCALALAKRRPDVRFLLIEQEPSFGGNHIWSYFDTDITQVDSELVQPLADKRWPKHDVRFPGRRRTLKLGYNSIRSSHLDAVVRSRLKSDQYRLGWQISEVGSTYVIAGGERIEAVGVIDARGVGSTAGLQLAWQKFVGRTYRYARPHGQKRAVIMDALVEQADGYRFIYLLPFCDTELMVEDTYYSADPHLDRSRLSAGLDALAARFGVCEEESEPETGVLPILLGGEVDVLWADHEPPVARIGMRGGFFHPTTGYSLPDAARNAALLCRQKEFDSAALHALFRARAAKLWDERRFFQLLNRMLFQATEPDQRYRVLEHFYRLPVPVVARFYAAELTALDKLRILSGRPPVPIRRAIAAMRNKAA